ncbi:hypothetical protein B0H16DRAFT_1497669 [Mycena metata]|uniref:RNA polymerase II assembly factor Rtp1 C-terminal domain-containing protein n=1 Tax=Mycena metata TaxID=1033252 RepID=A0AAD7NYK9_9AGAR|nr:hypothetical protein B0H16DRAFT_1497669 [Mycena metata]
MANLRTLLAAGLCIIESGDNSSPDLKSVLSSRLTRYYACLEQNTTLTGSETLQSLELTTAAESLSVLERVHEILDAEDAPIGTRDLAELRTLLAITFKWGVDPLLSRAMLAWPSKSARPQIIDLTTAPEDYRLLCGMVSRLLSVALPTNAPTFVTTTLLTRHLDQLLRPCIAIGWLPKSLASDSTPGSTRPLALAPSRYVRLVPLLPPSQTITALGAVLSVKPCPPHVHKACASLLSKQLLRPDGVRGLCAAVFGEDADEVQLEKIEHVARAYFSTITPRVLELLSDRAPPSYRRAGAFSISRMLATPAAPAVLAFLHPPLLSAGSTTPSPQVALSTIMTLSVSALYSLLYHLDQIKTSDPGLKEVLRGLLGTWGRVVGATEALAILWSVIDGQGGEWSALLTPADDEDIDLDTNILDLYPDPVHFVRFLKSIQRTDISSDLFVRLLESYRDSKSETDDDPTRSVKPCSCLQLVVQMQSQLSDGPSTILGKPAHMLSFVKHALDSGRPESETKKPSNAPPYQFNLNDSDEGDSDDDTPGADIISPDDEMIETSVNLLLAVLEANEDLSARTAPVLNEIFSLLEPLSTSTSSSLRSLAREARMVMTARLASTSAPKRSAREEDTTQETYQKALKLLQDPILPVRAHGLLLLRQLVTPQTSAKGAQLSDPALVPAILSIFLQSVQDDDSYIFLNAVQGLATMVDTYGKDVLRGLVKEYSQGLDGLSASNITQHDVDVRIRVGEALASVIKRCGSALPAFIDILVPPLFHLVRSSQVATTLRTSALSLLAECENTCSLALIPYVTELSEAMIDLLQIESSSNVSTESDDNNPLLANSKLPPFRRAALHFLGLLIRETTRQIYESAHTEFSNRSIKRIRTTLGYVASTDGDMVVRVMAREAVEGLGELEEAMLGNT